MAGAWGLLHTHGVLTQGGGTRAAAGAGLLAWRAACLPQGPRLKTCRTNRPTPRVCLLADATCPGGSKSSTLLRCKAVGEREKGERGARRLVLVLLLLLLGLLGLLLRAAWAGAGCLEEGLEVVLAADFRQRLWCAVLLISHEVLEVSLLAISSKGGGEGNSGSRWGEEGKGSGGAAWVWAWERDGGCRVHRTVAKMSRPAARQCPATEQGEQGLAAQAVDAETPHRSHHPAVPTSLCNCSKPTRACHNPGTWVACVAPPLTSRKASGRSAELVMEQISVRLLGSQLQHAGQHGRQAGG